MRKNLNLVISQQYLNRNITSKMLLRSPHSYLAYSLNFFLDLRIVVKMTAGILDQGKGIKEARGVMESLPVGLEPQTLKHLYLVRKKKLFLVLSRYYCMALGYWKDNLGEKVEGGKTTVFMEVIIYYFVILWGTSQDQQGFLSCSFIDVPTCL